MEGNSGHGQCILVPLFGVPNYPVPSKLVLFWLKLADTCMFWYDANFKNWIQFLEELFVPKSTLLG